MKKLLISLLLPALLMVSNLHADEPTLEEYLLQYDYAARWDMKITSRELVGLLQQDKVQFVDIRFAEEHATWKMGFGLHIPLPDLPRQLHRLDPDKLVVTACPLKDRAIIAMTYLKTKSFDVKYLADGMLGLAEYLRGDMALELTDVLPPSDDNEPLESSDICPG
ncbi:rhodanese-like domain-containing protein [Desulfonatronum sp. SC1]|uniref:rhodanese-like domain-containing protein n=1 Tax=Desulfonatronum sp. SC1 TaxID=2109626 RepID=UPI0018EE5072|nr:rhodanese-like domain-containing protein [Desulfonatronum sp. SC1]